MSCGLCLLALFGARWRSFKLFETRFFKLFETRFSNFLTIFKQFLAKLFETRFSNFLRPVFYNSELFIILQIIMDKNAEVSFSQFLGTYFDLQQISAKSKSPRSCTFALSEALTAMQQVISFICFIVVPLGEIVTKNWRCVKKARVVEERRGK